MGKAAFNLGAHKKGGGCDFLLPVERLKFHSQLAVHPSSRVTIAYANSAARTCPSLRWPSCVLPNSLPAVSVSEKKD